MLLPGLPLKIDDFRPRGGVRVFLLSHLHTDHLVGLTPTWDFGRIFCTAVTRALLLSKFPDLASLPDRVVALPLNARTQISLRDASAKLVSRDSVGATSREATQSVTVSLIDANHIPGSCMFIVNAGHDGGCYLYTGDFKWNGDEMLSDIARGTERRPVDHCFVDDTWLHLTDAASNSFLTLDKLDEKFEQIERYCRRERGFRQFEHHQADISPHLLSSSSEHRPFVVRCYLHNQFGKEILLQRLARRLQTAISVDDARWSRLCACVAVDPHCVDISRFRPMSRYAAGGGESTSSDPCGSSGSSMLWQRRRDYLLEVVQTRRQVSIEALAEATRDTGVEHHGLIMTGWAAASDACSQGGSRLWNAKFTLHSTADEVRKLVAAIRPKCVYSLDFSDAKRNSDAFRVLGGLLREPWVSTSHPLHPLENTPEDPSAKLIVQGRKRPRSAGSLPSRWPPNPSARPNSTGGPVRLTSALSADDLRVAPSNALSELLNGVLTSDEAACAGGAIVEVDPSPSEASTHL